MLEEYPAEVRDRRGDPVLPQEQQRAPSLEHEQAQEEEQYEQAYQQAQEEHEEGQHEQAALGSDVPPAAAAGVGAVRLEAVRLDIPQEETPSAAVRAAAVSKVATPPDAPSSPPAAAELSGRRNMPACTSQARTNTPACASGRPCRLPDVPAEQGRHRLPVPVATMGVGGASAAQGTSPSISARSGRSGGSITDRIRKGRVKSVKGSWPPSRPTSSSSLGPAAAAAEDDDIMAA